MSDVSYPPPPTPSSAPAAPPPPPAGPAFDFAKPFTYVFDDPRWMQKILIGGLFYLAAMVIVGLFFIMGYVAQTMRNIIRGDALPLPEWENLGEFFKEGLRLVGVVLCWILPLFVVAMLFVVPSILLGATGNEDLGALGGIFSTCLACLMVPLSLAVTVFLPGSLLFAVVEQRFGAAFEFGRLWQFIKGNIGNYLLAVVVHIVAQWAAGFGVILLCVGVIFTTFWSYLIGSHAFAQVYRLATKRA